MAEAPGVVRNISDTALWAAYFRAEETKRPDALFRDPYAERLEGAFQFGPAEGPRFFERYGWGVGEVQSSLKSAARFGRPPFVLRMLAKLPESKETPAKRPWSGVCMLQKSGIERG
jgi:hypothetical protein